MIYPIALKGLKRRLPLELDYLIKLAALGSKESLPPPENFDEELFFNAAASHKLSPLIFNHIKDRDSFSFQLKNRLRNSYCATLSRNIFLTEEYNKILSMKKKNNISVIPLQGIYTSQKFYQDIALRPMTDIDIFIKDTDYFKVKDLLGDLGYWLYDQRDEWYADFRGQCHFYNNDKGILVDLHWQIVDLDRYNLVKNIKTEELWERAEIDRSFGQETLTLSREDLILYTCLHISLQHSYAGVVNYIDLFKILSQLKEEIDWDAFILRTKKYRVTKPVYFSLYFAKEALGANIGKDILEALRLKRNDLMCAMLFKAIDKNIAEEALNSFSSLAMLDSLKEKVKFIIGNAKGSPRYFIHFLKIFLKGLRATLTLVLKK